MRTGIRSKAPKKTNRKRSVRYKAKLRAKNKVRRQRVKG